MSIVQVSTLDWPEDATPLENGTVHCAGTCFFDYELRRLEHRHFHYGSSFHKEVNSDEDTTTAATDDKKKKKVRDLLSMQVAQLEKLNYYQILGDLPLHSKFEDIKRAYHKACLKYHPDKTGRGEDDVVFLKVKAGFDTLSDVSKRKSYDSSISFNESIPKGGESEQEFYKVYAPVFARNLRFDARYDPERDLSKNNGSSSSSGGGGGGKKGNKKKRNSTNNKQKGGKPEPDKKDIPPPMLGDATTPMVQVHAFYDYWINFESWRDFSLKATKLTDNKDIESADSRYEKRHMLKEIDRKARSLKRDEMARINNLVERAMATDPRLKKERQDERDAKQRVANEKKEKEEAAAKQAEEEAGRLATEQVEQEQKAKEGRLSAKAEREKQKKQLRKARQLLRKLTLSAHSKANGEGVWKSLEEANDDVELLCEKLTAVQITELSDLMGGADAIDNPNLGQLVAIKQRVEDTQDDMAQDSLEAKKVREEGRKAAAEKLQEAKANRVAKPWSKEELTALTKGAKKYPAGGANRWDTISQFINNLCKPVHPRTKDECIEQYNKLIGQSRPAAAVTQSSTPSTASVKAATDGPTVPSIVWTEEDDKLLQAGLARYLATMDKNERWTSIAATLPDKTKKDCVQRFKAIRDALKSK